MKLPRWTILVSLMLTVCVLTAFAAAAPGGMQPSNGNNNGMQNNAGGGAHPAPGNNGGNAAGNAGGHGGPGGSMGQPPAGLYNSSDPGNPGSSRPGNFSPFDETNLTRMQNRSWMGPDNGNIPGDGGFIGRGNMTVMYNRTRPAIDDTTIPFNETIGWGGRGASDNRSRMDLNNATPLFNGTAPPDATMTGPAPGMGMNRQGTTQLTPLDELLASLQRYLQSFS